MVQQAYVQEQRFTKHNVYGVDVYGSSSAVQ